MPGSGSGQSPAKDDGVKISEEVVAKQGDQDVDEKDDFGLPIRKVPVKEAEEVLDKSGEAGTKDTTSTDSMVETPDVKLDPAASQTDKGDESDGEEFKDALSTPLPITPNPAPPLPENQKGVEQRQQEDVKKDLSDHDNDGKDDDPKKDLPKEHPSEPVPRLTDAKDDDPKKDLPKEHSSESVPKLTDAKDAPAKNEELPRSPIAAHPVHKRNQSSVNGVSEWSHQQTITEDKKDEEDEEGEWQTMPAFAPFDMYNDDNKLIAREREDSDDDGGDQGLGGAGKGYTRVQLDEDAQSATSMDENTQYLFKDVNGGTGAGFDDEEQRDAVSQMQATKDLLTEGQRIAYVGMTRLALSSMLKVAESLENRSKGSKKETALASEAIKMWSQKMMVRIYAHMDISAAEQIMIEQLAEHGVEPGDLTPTLMQNARVKNPMAEEQPKGRPDSSLSFEKSSRNSISTSSLHDEEVAAPPPAYEEHEGEDLPEVRMPSQLPTTKSIDIDLRWTVLCDLFLTLIADSIYDARSRVLLEIVGQHMDISWLEICRFEKRVTDALEMQQAAEKENWNEDEHKESRRKAALKKRYMMMGLATVGGSLVIGLSAGLLAPVIGAGLAAGFTTIGVAGTSGFLAGAGGAAIITSAAATSGGIVGVRAANRRTGAVKTFEYRPLHNNKRVNLIVTVSGWMTGKMDDVRLPYSTIDPIMGDIYSVLWEPEMLTSMGQTIQILATEALTQGLQQVLGSTILVGLMAALQLPVVLTKLAYLIDNPWTVSLDRANMAGLILADSLIDRNLGTRPVTFVGYSLGSRVIFSCLRELARKGAYGLVQNVYLFGSPIVAKKDEYLKARTVVAGRFVNGYAKNDWILGYLFRLTSGGISKVAGLAPVEDIPGMENVDVTEFVPGHMSYRTAMPRLLREVGWSVESDEFTEIEDPDPENHQQRQRELINEIEEARKEFEQQEKEKASKGKFGFFSRKKKTVVEKKEWEMYQESKAGDVPPTEPQQGNNHGVLFDIDAIRAELASEHMEVKELKSTLPPMKLDLNSTPPALRNNLRETKSFNNSTSLSAQPPISSPPPARSPSYNYSTNQDYNEFDDNAGNIQMSFEPALPRNGGSLGTKSPVYSPSPSPSPRMPPQAEPLDRAVNLQRPDLKSSNTLPTGTSVGIGIGAATGVGAGMLAMGVERNAWADDDEEFAEKEMEMTFA